MAGRQELWLLLKKMPKGKVATCKIPAGKLGSHPRAVGKMLNSNPRPIVVPCRRVVRSDGGIGGYALGIKRKFALLKKEWIKIEKGKINLNGFLFGF